MNRDELLEMMQRNQRGKSKLLFAELQKTILDYQLHEHLKFLFRFTVIFKLVDQDGNGVLSEEEFKILLLDKMQVIESKQEVNYLLKIVDPYNNQKMTYSEIVHLLSSHLVPLSDQEPLQRVTLLEKFVQLLGLDFEHIELEMKMRDEEGYI